jgi:hypothetical protein
VAKKLRGLSVQVHTEKGTITEIGASNFDRNMQHYSHILLEDENGKTIRINNVTTDSAISPSIQVGNGGYFAIVSRSTAFGLGQRRNAILGFGNDSGQALAKEPRLQPLVFIGGALLVGLYFMLTVGGPTLIFAPFMLVFLLILVSSFRGRSVVAEVRQTFAGLNVADNTSKVY